MNGVCVCCGTYGHVESHHVGGRAYSDVVTDACPPCHRVLSAWQNERRWHTDSEDARVTVGALDIVRLIVHREGFGDAASDVADSLNMLAQQSGLYDRRPASYDIEPVDVTPDPMCDFEWFVTAMRLLQDITPIVLGEAPAESITDQVAAHIAALDYERAYRAATTFDRQTTVRRRFTEMAAITGYTLNAFWRVAQQGRDRCTTGEQETMPLPVVAETLRYTMSDYRDLLSTMVKSEEM